MIYSSKITKNAVIIKKNKPSVKIYIITGIRKEYPHWYRICIAPDMKDWDPIDDGKRYCTILSRKHTMTPSNSINIDQFIKHYNIFKGCWLMALKIGSDNNIIMPNSFDSAFKFTNIIFRNAWELSTGDDAFMAIEPDDDPFIPIGQEKTAPIVKSLELLRQRIKSQ